QITQTSLPDTTIVIGRQRIIFDDHRFVANVGWRQNEQTYDAVRLTNRSLGKLTVDLAYFDQVNRVFGKESPVGRFTGDNYAVNVSYPLPVGKLTGFAYLLDFDEAPAESSRTLGFRYAGERTVRKVKLAWALSGAVQEDRAGNPLDYSEEYY